MKILFVDHPEGDFLAATLFLGLCREYGTDNVVDWPWKASYHGSTAYYPSVYGPAHGIGETGPFAWFPAQEGRQWTSKEVRARIREFDLVLMSRRDHGVLHMRELIAAVERQAIQRIAIFDGQDDTSVRWDAADEFGAYAYFKRELFDAQADERNGCRLLPCPFASPFVQPSAVGLLDYDVSHLGAGNFFPGVVERHKVSFGAANKAEVDERLRQALAGRRFIGGHVGYEDFLRATARSKIAVCLGGFGWDTFRHWEIPSFEDVLLVRNRSPQIQPYPFIDGETCAEFSTLDEMIAVVQRYLTDDDLRLRVGRAGNAHLWKYHTARARARWLVEEALQ